MTDGKYYNCRQMYCMIVHVHVGLHLKNNHYCFACHSCSFTSSIDDGMLSDIKELMGYLILSFQPLYTVPSLQPPNAVREKNFDAANMVRAAFTKKNKLIAM